MKMKILFGMPASNSWGGPASSEPPFVKAFRNLDADVTEAVYVYGDKEKPTPFFERVRRVVKTAFHFRRFIRQQDFDIIHLNTAFDIKTILRDSFSLFVIAPKRAKIFLKLHGSEAQDLTKTNFLGRFLIRYIRRKVHGFGIHTHDELENFKALGFDADKFFFVKNALTFGPKELGEFTRSRKSKGDVFELLFVARFVPKKCLIETIEACRIIKDRGYDCLLYCIGDGETRQTAQELVDRYKLQDRVIFTGYLPETDVSAHFFERDILIFPTKYGEGFPNVFFKALATGMPIVSTPFRAARELLKENKNYLACTTEPESIAEKVIELIENEQLRHTISDNNREFGRSLTPESVARDFFDIYTDILNKNQT